MSNYNREWFPGFENRILVEAEDVNGTGEVRITFSDDWHDGTSETVTFGMDHEQAAAFAAFVARKADQALSAYLAERS